MKQTNKMKNEERNCQKRRWERTACWWEEIMSKKYRIKQSEEQKQQVYLSHSKNQPQSQPGSKQATS